MAAKFSSTYAIRLEPGIGTMSWLRQQPGERHLPSIASIAAEAGVDRRTVYRRFASREELLAAIYQSRLEAIEQAVEEARLREAPVANALHRYVEGIIAVNRRWPVELGRMLADASISERRNRVIDEVDALLDRATDEGLLRPGLPSGWASALMPQLMNLAVRQLPHLSAAQAADVVVDTFLHGTGRPRANEHIRP